MACGVLNFLSIAHTTSLFIFSLNPVKRVELSKLSLNEKLCIFDQNER